MQKESTIQFWDEYHEQNVEKEWLVHGTSDLLESIYRNCGSTEVGRLRILEIGCGTSAMARELWKYIEHAESKVPNSRRVLVRSTDVSRVCVDSCFARDRNMSNVYGPGDLAVEGCGLEYATLDVQVEVEKYRANDRPNDEHPKCNQTQISSQLSNYRLLTS